MQNIFTSCNPFDPSTSLDGCLVAVPKMQCTDITSMVDSIKQAKKMPNNNTFCSSIHSTITPIKLKGAATSGDTSPQRVSLTKQYTDWYKNTITPCIVNMCKMSAFPMAQADLNSALVRAVEELITSQLSGWEKFAFMNCKGVATGVVISFIVLLTVIGYLINTHK
jgi:hypothetical protein